MKIGPAWTKVRAVSKSETVYLVTRIVNMRPMKRYVLLLPDAKVEKSI